MAKTKEISVERQELNKLTERLKTVEETLLGAINKLDAMNKYYAQTITVTNEQMTSIKENNKKITEIYNEICGKKTEALELKTKKK